MRASLLIIGWLLVSVFLLAPLSDGVSAGHSTAHWDFESEESVDVWGVHSGGLSWSPDQGIGGSAAAALTTEASPFGARPVRVVHPLSVIPGASYQLRGQFVSAEGKITRVDLALSFHFAQGGQLDPSTQRLFLPGAWSFSLLAPCDSIASELVIDVEGEPGATAYVDELSLELVAPPSEPCPAAEPTEAGQAVIPLEGPRPSVEAPAFDVADSAGKPASSKGLLTNEGFEAAEDGVPLRWRTFGGILTQTTTPVRSGNSAGAFTSASESTKWVYQTVSVTPAAWYRFDGYVYLSDLGADAALLRISWYTSPDGSGRAVATVDSTSQLDEPAPRFRYLTTGPVQAPPGVHSGRLRILLRPRSAASTVIYIDDLSFSPSGPGPIDTAAIARTSRHGGASADEAAWAPAADRPEAAFPLTPFPTPVIVRSSHLRVPEPSPSHSSEDWWPWAATASVVLVASVAGCGWWWRTRQT